MKRRTKQILTTGVAVAVVLVALPVALPWMAISESFRKRAMRRAAEAATCVACGGPLGTQALTLADQHWSEKTSALRRSHPRVRFRLVRFVDAICPSCGTFHRFDSSRREFVATRGSGVERACSGDSDQRQFQNRVQAVLSAAGASRRS